VRGVRIFFQALAIFKKVLILCMFFRSEEAALLREGHVQYALLYANTKCSWKNFIADKENACKVREPYFPRARARNVSNFLRHAQGDKFHSLCDEG
jgi:hypothetical protein